MNYYLIFILAVIIGTYLLDLFVERLNLRNLETELPEEFKGYYDRDRYKKAQEYLVENTRFSLINSSIVTPVSIAFILLGGFNLADRFARSLNLDSILTGLVFTGVLLLAYQLLEIPFSVYETFVVEEKYGFNRTAPKTFILDILKSWFLTAVIGGAALYAIIWFFESSGKWAWFYCWMIVAAFRLLLAFLAPAVIMPLFNRYTPLEKDDLREAIEAYAKSQNFKLKGVYQMDGSRRSAKANAFFTGFGRFRRIVLFDTLIEKHTTAELVSVLAHEMGHYKKGHIWMSMLLSFLTSGLMFYILSLFIDSPQLFAAFRMESTSVYASLVFFGFLYQPVDTILSVFGNIISRRNEYAADAYAVKTVGNPRAMIEALKKLSVDNLSNLTPHPVKVFMSYRHPPVLQRIREIRDIPSVGTLN
ncbi:MAG: M48 family metallopeptidase [Acidobacteria bacterium]|nr:M48 family metallopeptidase [Acidobacteriota bacterium]